MQPFEGSSDVQQGQPFISFGPEVCELLKLFGVTDAERTSRVVIEFKAGDLVTVTSYQAALFPQLDKVKELIEKFNIIKKEDHSG